MNGFWSTVLNIVIFLISLSILVCIHEAGHLTAAKIFKVYCYEFSIGMGPSIYSHKPNKKKNQETMFSIRALPIGGYVSMAGEDLENAEGVDKSIVVPKDRVLESKARWKQVIIMFAGVFMNFVLGYILLLISFSTATQAVQRLDWNKVQVSSGTLDNQIQVDENGNEITTDNPVKLKTDDEVTNLKIVYDYKDNSGNTYSSKTIESNITSYEIESLQGLEKNTQLAYLLSNNFYTDTAVINYGNLNDIKVKLNVDTSKLSSITRNIYITFNSLQEDNTYSLEKYYTKVTSSSTSLKDSNYTFETIGIAPAFHYFKYTFAESFTQAWNRWCYSCSALFVAVAGLFNPSNWSQMGGIISIFKLSAQASTIGFGTYLNFWALISVNLGVMNLLPFPALDGWQILITICEGAYIQVKKAISWIKSKIKKEDATQTSIKQNEVEVSFRNNKTYKKVKQIVSLVGMFLLFGLMIALIVKDIINPII